MEKNNKTKIGRIIVYAGAEIAFLIGASFATGQEMLMYFVSWGSSMYVIAAVIFILLIWASLTFAIAGSNNRFENNSEIFTFFCGKYFGKFYDIFSVILCFACYLFMIAGAGSTVSQQFGLPPAVGSIAMSIMAVATVSLGLSKITDILGRLGTVIISIVVISAVCNLIKNYGSISENLALINAGETFGMTRSIA